MADDDFSGGPTANDDVVLPKATVNKFANDVAATLDVRLTMDTRELIADCCSEFVQLLSSEANEICEKDAKKTITPEHVLRALRQLGFERYFQEVAEDYERVKADDKGGKREKARKDRKKGNVPTEELLALQEALFAKAREDPLNSSGAGGSEAPQPPPPIA
jgi:down-regulator of transcription 1